MIIYVLTFLYFLLLAYIYDYHNYDRGVNLHFYISLILLICISGFRYQMGPDSVTYEMEFNRYDYDFFSNINNDRGYQPLWILLNIICKSYGGFVLFQFICASITNINIFYFITKTTSRRFSVILLYYILQYLYFCMDILRESIAVSFALVGIVFLLENKRLKSLLCFFLGFLFHLSLLIFLPSVIVCSIKKISSKLILLCGLFFVIITAISSNSTMFLINLSGLQNFETYADSDVSSLRMSIFGLLYIFSVPLVLFVILRKASKPILMCTKDNIFIEKLCCIYIIFVLLRYFVPFVDRLFNYYDIINECVIVTGMSIVFNSVNNRALFRRYLIGIILLLGISFYKSIRTSSLLPIPPIYRYYPYNSIFEKNIVKERELLMIYEERTFE